MPHPRVLELLPGTKPLLRPGTEAVAYHIPVSPSGNNKQDLRTTIVLPRGSAWTSGQHYHVIHVEYLRLVAGSIFVELDGQTKFFSAASGGELSISTGRLVQTGIVIRVPRYARHNWGRTEHLISSNNSTFFDGGNKLPEDWSDEVIVEEWTEPSDLGKPLFFWNLNGVITAPEDSILLLRQNLARFLLGSWWVPFQLFVIFYELDNWPIFFPLTDRLKFYLGDILGGWLGKSLEHLMTFVVLFMARAMAWALRVSAVTRERTPHGLWEAYRKSGI
jgi:hypothetical protein